MLIDKVFAFRHKLFYIRFHVSVFTVVVYGILGPTYLEIKSNRTINTAVENAFESNIFNILQWGHWRNLLLKLVQVTVNNAPVAYRTEASIYICMSGVVEYSGSEKKTKQANFIQTRKLLLNCPFDKVLICENPISCSINRILVD